MTTKHVIFLLLLVASVFAGDSWLITRSCGTITCDEKNRDAVTLFPSGGCDMDDTQKLYGENPVVQMQKLGCRTSDSPSGKKIYTMYNKTDEDTVSVWNCNRYCHSCTFQDSISLSGSPNNLKTSCNNDVATYTWVSSRIEIGKFYPKQSDTRYNWYIQEDDPKNFYTYYYPYETVAVATVKSGTKCFFTRCDESGKVSYYIGSYVYNDKKQLTCVFPNQVISENLPAGIQCKQL